MSTFMKSALNRAIRTMAQTAVSMLPVCACITEINWLMVLGTALFAGVLSLLTSVATGLPEAREGESK